MTPIRAGVVKRVWLACHCERRNVTGAIGVHRLRCRICKRITLVTVTPHSMFDDWHMAVAELEPQPALLIDSSRRTA